MVARLPCSVPCACTPSIGAPGICCTASGSCSQLQSLAAPLPSHFRSPDLESRTQNRQENTLRLQRRRAARFHACSNHCLRAQSTCVEDPCEVHHRPPQAPLTVYTLRERRTCRANRTRSAVMRDACCSGGQISNFQPATCGFDPLSRSFNDDSAISPHSSGACSSIQPFLFTNATIGMSMFVFVCVSHLTWLSISQFAAISFGFARGDGSKPVSCRRFPAAAPLSRRRTKSLPPSQSSFRSRTMYLVRDRVTNAAILRVAPRQGAASSSDAAGRLVSGF
mmetsp:Transcript_17995/g.46090  ORF Transcript_17995/g.46090 Transcript_17995/m.46090 type:complete len:280 (+) Transcript_17995:281-1120(+)